MASYRNLAPQWLKNIFAAKAPQEALPKKPMAAYGVVICSTDNPKAFYTAEFLAKSETLGKKLEAELAPYIARGEAESHTVGDICSFQPHKGLCFRATPQAAEAIAQKLQDMLIINSNCLVMGVAKRPQLPKPQCG